MPLATAAVITSTARLLTPLINDLYKGAKKIGARGFQKWEEKTFPRKLARRIRAIDEVKTIWSPEKEASLSSFYYPSKLVLEGKPKLATRLAELEGKNAVIEGTVGQGKSILLRNLAIEEILSNDAKRLPVFVELRSLSAKLTLQQAIIKQLSSYDIEVDEDSLSYLQRSGRLAYLLDGFDELDESLEKETLHELEFLSQKYPELLIVVTSRPNNAVQKSAAFRIIPVAPLTPGDYAPFINKLGITATQAVQIKEAIRKSPSKLTSLISTPLMLTMVVIVYQSEYEIPETLPEFFDKLFHVVFTRHDKLKAAYSRKHHSGLSERKLQNLFEAFCFMSMQNSFTRSLSSEQFEKAFNDAAEYVEDCKCESENFKLDLTKVACLMIEEGLDTTTFLHKSIMEYYAASFIKHSADEVAAMFYTNVVPDSRSWWEVLSFLREIDTFRYSRDFALPESSIIRANYFEDENQRTNNALINILTKCHPGLCLSLTPSDESNQVLKVFSYGPFQQEKHLGMRSFSTVLMESMDKTMPDSLSLSGMHELFGGVNSNEESGAKVYEIPVTLLITKLGSEHFWKAIDVFLSQINNQSENALKIIQQQEKRKDIFSKKQVIGKQAQ